MNDNQNHLVKPGRTTSRVLAPPGGKTSICLGGYVEPPAPKKTPPAVAPTPPSPPVAVSAATTSAETTTVASPETKPQQQQKEQPISANAFASGSNMNGAQVMTGRPTSRVLAPPGGHTSIQLG